MEKNIDQNANVNHNFVVGELHNKVGNAFRQNSPQIFISVVKNVNLHNFPLCETFKTVNNNDQYQTLIIIIMQASLILATAS